MNTKVAKVMRGFLELSEDERTEFISEINKYLKGDQALRKSLNESVRDVVKSSTVNFGPSPAGGCPCCGK